MDGILGIEGGGTRTVALLADERGRQLGRKEFGPGNVRLLSDKELSQLFQRIAAEFPKVQAVGAGLAGARDPRDCKRVEATITQCWGDVPRDVTHDLEIALATLPEKKSKILVLSGTGSCCFGESNGHRAKIGGWGHILGDKGSGYEIGLRAMKASVFYFDRDGKWGTLGQRILRALMLNEPNQLIEWVQTAEKSQVAALAPEVFLAAKARDAIARDILEGAAASLAKDALTCANRLRLKKGGVFLLAGSVLKRQPAFARRVGDLITAKYPDAEIKVLDCEAVWGAVQLGKQAITSSTTAPPKKRTQTSLEPKRGIYVPTFDPLRAPTEQRNPRSTNLDRLSFETGVKLFLEEESGVSAALFAERTKIARAARLAFETLDSQGRIFYIGAGTSGRLGILDASECPPTFRADPEMIQGIIAGGARAIWQAVEGAEDDPNAGADALRFRAVTKKDLVIGIAASGRTPFVWGAFHEAKNRKAKTILICFNPFLEISKAHQPDLVIAPNTGPELLTGSTRLKSGTATKLILNAISTLAMVKLGKVVSNLMVDLNPSNLKLRDRAIRIVRELTGKDAWAAQNALEQNGWVIKQALDSFHQSDAGARRIRKKSKLR